MFGYPSEASEPFAEYGAADHDKGYAIASDEFLGDRLSEGVFNEQELAYLAFIKWVPAMTDKCVRAAVEVGRERYETLTGWADENRLERFSQRLEELYEQSIEEYARLYPSA